MSYSIAAIIFTLSLVQSLDFPWNFKFSAYVYHACWYCIKNIKYLFINFTVVFDLWTCYVIRKTWSIMILPPPDHNHHQHQHHKYVRCSKFGQIFITIKITTNWLEQLSNAWSWELYHRPSDPCKSNKDDDDDDGFLWLSQDGFF